MNKSIYIYCLLMIVGFISCEIDEPEIENTDNLINTWVVEKVFIDGVENNYLDYSQWRLDLLEEGNYDYTDRLGEQESGDWSIQSDNGLLLLDPEDGDPLAYNIISFYPDTLELLINKNEFFKDNVFTQDFRYVLIPAQ